MHEQEPEAQHHKTLKKSTHSLVQKQVTRNPTERIRIQIEKHRHASLAVVSIVLIAVALGVIHSTPLRYRADPLGSALENARITMARDNVAKANTHLSIAEAKLRDIVSLRSESPGSAYLDPLITSMVEHDKMAMRYMDRAKNDGKDIRQLNLVKRLCDLLGEQDKVLASAHTELRDLHEFADELEGRVMNGQDIHAAMEEVNQSLDAAMHW